MNHEELDQRVAVVFQIEGEGSDALRARLQSLTELRITPPSVGIFRLRKSALGLVITTAFAVCILAFSHVRKPVTASAAVRRALSNINTWHLKGWQTRAGHKVKWEVWGRKVPFFYREQVGNNTVLDDGRQRLSIFGPNRDGDLIAGVSVRLPSLQQDANVPWSYSQMVEQWRNAGKPWKQTAQGPVFNFNAVNMEGYGVNTDNLYSIDGRTWLPTRYEKRVYNRGHESSRRTVALLDADYDSPIPVSAAAVVSPAGFHEFDALATPQRVPTKGSASANGFTLLCEPLAVSADGSILVKMRGWLGNTPLPATQGDVHFQVNDYIAA